MPSFFEIQPGQLINLSLVRHIMIFGDRALFTYADGTEQVVRFAAYDTGHFVPAAVQKRLRALGQAAELAIYA